jgi:hypothetical protein
MRYGRIVSPWHRTPAADHPFPAMRHSIGRWPGGQ